MIILVINCGSSSIKYQLLDMKSDDVYDLMAKGVVEKIGLPEGILTHKPTGKPVLVRNLPIPDHKVGMELLLAALVDPESGVLRSFDDIEAVGHRIVQGADFFSGSALVDEDVLSKIEICCDFAPLHNPAHLLGIRAMQKVLPTVPQVVTFDTAFHQTMPGKAFMYAVPYEYYENDGVRRYGFHGTSHRYVSSRCAELMGKPIEELKIISCHMGNGSSIAAIDGGKCVDTSMGFTPLVGLPMGTRCGDLDAGVIQFLMNKHHYSIDEMLNILNKKSGVLGISGVSSDFRDLDSAASAGNERAKLALDMFHYWVAKVAGSYVAAMNGVDAIVFTAGVGENSKATRAAICDYFGYLGVTVDNEANSVRGEDIMISTPDSPVKVFVIPTNEELVIARDTRDIVS